MKNLAIFSLFVVAAASQAQGTITRVCGDGFTIVDNTKKVSTINITTPGTLSSITLVNLTHTWAGDLIAKVTGPSGTFTLFDNIGGGGPCSGDSSNFAGTYSFANGGSNIWTEAAAGNSSYNMAPGTYSTSDNVGTQLTMPTTLGVGVYTLSIEDICSGDDGALGQWCIEYTPVPEPASMAVLGAGALALIRRRRSK